MVKKKIKKVVEEDGEARLVKKSIRENEEKQLFWFFVVVGVVFAIVLVSYLWAENAKSFEHVGVDWVIEDYENLRIYHGRFMALSGANLNYNVFLRGDPRENDVSTEGTFDKFKNGGVVSMTPEVDACRGELSRVMLDLGAFLRQGVGVGSLIVGSTDKFVAVESDRIYAQCNSVSDRTIVIVKLGDGLVVQDNENPYCYTIYAESCEDISSVEKFIIKAIDDFGRVE